MTTRWLLGLALACLAGFAPARPQGDAGFEVERARAVPQLISGLEAYAEWCSTKKVWLERNRAMQAILLVDPGNMSAKRSLGWSQVADGVWEPPANPKPAKNYDLSALKEAPARYAEAVRPWCERVVQLLEQHAAELTPVQRELAYGEVLSIDPENEFVRRVRREKRTEKGWVLEESVNAKARRGEIKELVRAALASAPDVEDISPGAGDQAYGVEWKACVGTARVRVLSSGERAEAERAAKTLHAVQDVFGGVFGTRTLLDPGFTIYLLCDEASKSAFIAHLVGGNEAKKSFMAQVEGSGVPGAGNGAWWAKDEDRRLDGITRHTFGTLFQREFKLTVDAAWAWEGFGLYLTREMIGTRLTWYIVPLEEGQSGTKKAKGPDWMKKLLTPGTNWMNEGYRLLREGDVSSMASTLGRPLNRMTPQDLFQSYVLAAYLLEGQHERLPKLLRALGGEKGTAGLKTPQALGTALSMDLAEFHARVERWLGERR